MGGVFGSIVKKKRPPYSLWPTRLNPRSGKKKKQPGKLGLEKGDRGETREIKTKGIVHWGLR